MNILKLHMLSILISFNFFNFTQAKSDLDIGKEALISIEKKIDNGDCVKVKMAILHNAKILSRKFILSKRYGLNMTLIEYGKTRKKCSTEISSAAAHFRNQAAAAKIKSKLTPKDMEQNENVLNACFDFYRTNLTLPGNFVYQTIMRTQLVNTPLDSSPAYFQELASRCGAEYDISIAEYRNKSVQNPAQSTSSVKDEVNLR